MPMPSSGKITTQTFRDFFEITASTPINSSDWYRGGPYVRANYQSQNSGVRSINNQVPTSGRIALSDLYGVYKVVDANNYVPGNTNPNNTTDNVPGNPNPNDFVPYVPSDPPTNDYGAGPAGAHQDPFSSSNSSDAGDGADSGGGPPNFGSGDNEAADGSDPSNYNNNPDGGVAGDPAVPAQYNDGLYGPPGSGDPNVNPTTSNDPNTNPPYWADHERLV